ncbi:MAG: hypothetical protein IPJ08_14200 [Burkholderiales bacterium]|nr:hypothetical protein [Burkholderiales bacterium]
MDDGAADVGHGGRHPQQRGAGGLAGQQVATSGEVLAQRTRPRPAACA